MSHAPHSPSVTAQLEPYDDPEPGSTWFVSLAGVIILVALIIFIAAVAFRAEHTEFQRKVVDRSVGAIPVIPPGALDASSARALERSIVQRRDDGLIGRAEFAKLSQGVMLQSWMRYPWEDAKGGTRQLIRIPITEAMSIVAKEYEAKVPAKKVAAAVPAPSADAPTASAADMKEGATP